MKFRLPLERVERIEDQATHTWLDAGQGDLPVDTDRVIHHYPIQMNRVNGLPDNIEAEFDLSGNPPYSLLVNKKRLWNRIRFTEAHETGHWVMHREYIKGRVYRESDWNVVEAYSSGKPPEPFELEANTFAAALLMPKDDFSRQIANMYEYGHEYEERLVERYNVSHAALDRRISRLRPGFVLSGRAWPSGVIRDIVPTLDLETSEPVIAEAAWSVPEMAAIGQYQHIPSRFMPFVKSLQANQAYARDYIGLAEVLPNFKSRVEGDLKVWRKNQKELCFELILG